MMAIAPVTPLSPASAVTQASAQVLPALILEARRAAASLVLGEHGKRQAGSGEDFWQHREWTQGESLRQMDWRRSARSDTLFVRERERQVPALLQIWCDHSAGMDFSSTSDIMTKAQCGLVVGLALAIAARAGGERVTAPPLGAPFVNALAFAHNLIEAGQAFGPNLRSGHLVIISDGLGSLETWAQRAGWIAAQRVQPTLVLIQDPSERDFPFEGRIAFDSPQAGRPVLIGRAQSARAHYQAAHRAHLDAVAAIVRSGGGQVFEHGTDGDIQPLLRALAASLMRPNLRSSGN